MMRIANIDPSIKVLHVAKLGGGTHTMRTCDVVSIDDLRYDVSLIVTKTSLVHVGNAEAEHVRRALEAADGSASDT